MMRRTMVIVTVVMLVLGAVQAFAHDEFRIIGTVTLRQDTRIQVTTSEREIKTVAVSNATPITRDGKKVAATELKTGLYVVVDAIGDTEDDLVAMEVRIVPAPRR